MRRKCFFITLVIIFTIILLEGLGVELKKSSMENLAGQSVWLQGKIVGIQQSDDENFKAELKIEDKREKILLTVEEKTALPENLYNQKVEVEVKLKKPSVRRNPRGFDYSMYLKSKDIHLTGYVSKLIVINHQQNVYDRLLSLVMKKRFAFENSLNGKYKGIVCGVLFGETAFLDEEIYNEFQKNGTAHVLAVSGLHVGILYGIYEKLTGESKRPFALIFLFVMLFLYGTLSMWTPSVSRACLMILIRTFAQLKDLRYDMPTALSTVALVLIIHNPYVVFGAGFQMSFIAIASISFFYPLTSMKIPSSMATMLAVNGGLSLYQIYQFNYLSLSALMANIPIIYLAGILVPVAFLDFLFFCFFGNVKVLTLILEIFSLGLLKMNNLTSLNGTAFKEIVSPPLFMVVIAYFVAFYMASEFHLILKLRGEKGKDRRWLICLLVMAMVCGGLNYSPMGRDQVVFVDVGQGDCIHIRGREMDVMIDGGGNMNYNVGENVLKPYFLKNGTAELDLAVVTHLHMDHFKGVEELSSVFPVEKLVSGMKKGDVIKIEDDIYLETLWPVEIPDEGQEENRYCSVFMVYYEGVKILITGDLDEEGERMLLKEYGESDSLKADVLKIGHHGSNSSSCQDFLDAVNPDIAVIQVGADNMYGHPHTKVIERCEKKGIMVYRNDLDGAVSLRIKNGKIADIHKVIS